MLRGVKMCAVCVVRTLADLIGEVDKYYAQRSCEPALLPAVTRTGRPVRTKTIPPTLYIADLSPDNTAVNHLKSYVRSVVADGRWGVMKGLNRHTYPTSSYRPSLTVFGRKPVDESKIHVFSTKHKNGYIQSDMLDIDDLGHDMMILRCTSVYYTHEIPKRLACVVYDPRHYLATSNVLFYYRLANSTGYFARNIRYPRAERDILALTADPPLELPLTNIFIRDSSVLVRIDDDYATVKATSESMLYVMTRKNNEHVKTCQICKRLTNALGYYYVTVKDGRVVYNFGMPLAGQTICKECMSGGECDSDVEYLLRHNRLRLPVENFCPEKTKEIIEGVFVRKNGRVLVDINARGAYPAPLIMNFHCDWEFVSVLTFTSVPDRAHGLLGVNTSSIVKK